MTSKSFLQKLKWAPGLPLLLMSGFKCLYSQDKPNIILIYIDDMGWKDVEYNGSQYAKTPNIDKLSEQGMTFTNAYANAPNCAPSRACMISGQYTPRHGVYTVGNSDQGDTEERRLIPTPNPTDFIPDSSITMAEALKDAGYVSASMGKWHIGKDPTTQGFDLNIGGKGKGNPGSGGYKYPYNNLPGLDDGVDGEYLTDRLTDEAIKFIDTNKDKPFFLYLTHYAVHTPLQAKADKEKKFKSLYPDLGDNWITYLAMIESVDESVGDIIEHINQLGLDSNTAIIFYSDNGGLPNHTSMAPLRGNKGMLYEGGIRVPFIFKWPGQVQAGSTSSTTIVGTDLYPTFLEMAQATPPANYELDGESLLPILKQTGSLKRQSIFFHSPIYLRKEFSQVKEPFRTIPSSAMIRGPWKLIEEFGTGNIRLFNLDDDIGEHNDLAEYMPDTVSSLLKELQDWREHTNAPVPTEPNPGFVKHITFSKIPQPGDIFEASDNNSAIVKMEGVIKNTDIDTMFVQIFNNAELVEELVFHPEFIDGSSPFVLEPDLPASLHPYKFKVLFTRKTIREIDKIKDEVYVQGKVSGQSSSSQDLSSSDLESSSSADMMSSSEILSSSEKEQSSTSTEPSQSSSSKPVSSSSHAITPIRISIDSEISIEHIDQHIDININETGSEFTIKLLDLSGKILYSETEKSNSFKIPTATLLNGIYFIHVSHREKTFIKSLPLLQ